MKTKFQCRPTSAPTILSEAAKTGILLLCHDLTTRLRLTHVRSATGAMDFAARTHVARRIARRLKLPG